MTNDSTLVTENKGLFSPISQLFFEFYDDGDALLEQLKGNSDVQCIVGKQGLSFGEAQQPGLFAYADGVDTMQFLLSF
ncbi:MAG: hypothetical protein EOP54_31945 [Sphingobacteriales bacterium]|nr:MAG: hypothetical protein EOP54_31945 [Sphingobacteriales bacterium]